MKVIVIMPAYNAAQTLERTYADIPMEVVDHIILFDTEVIAQTKAFGFRIGEIPVPPRYFSEASSVDFKRSLIYGLGTLWTMFRFTLNRLGLVKCETIAAGGKQLPLG